MAQVSTAASGRLYEGVLFKRGKVNKSWKERWFVLTKEFKLNYYETKAKSEETFIVNNDRNVLGSIDLLQVEKVEVSQIKETSLSLIPKYIKILSNDNVLNALKDDRSFLIHLTTSSRTYKLSANDSESFIKWIVNLHKYLYDGVIFESYLNKKGEVNKAFKTRYFVLNKYKHLKYYNNEYREILHGYIDLNDPSISLNLPSKDYYFNQDNYIQLITEKRKWILCAKEADLFQEWIAYLSKLDEMEDVKSSKHIPFYMKNDDKERKIPKYIRKHGDIFKEWIKAQKEMENGSQPMICKKYQIELININNYSKKHQMSTVHDTVRGIQNLLDLRTSSKKGNNKYRSYGVDAADYTDNEMSDEYDDDEDDDDDDNDDNEEFDDQTHDFLNMMDEEYKQSDFSNLTEKEYLFKSIDYNKNIIICFDTNNNNNNNKDIEFSLNGLNSNDIQELKYKIEEGTKQNKNVKITVLQIRGKNNKITKQVSCATIQ